MINIFLYLLSGLSVLYAFPAMFMNVGMLFKLRRHEEDVRSLLRWSAFKSVAISVSMLCFGLYINPSLNSISFLNFIGALGLLLAVSSIISFVETKNKSVGAITLTLIIFGVWGLYR